jgi:hypothetical protein
MVQVNGISLHVRMLVAVGQCSYSTGGRTPPTFGVIRYRSSSRTAHRVAGLMSERQFHGSESLGQLAVPNSSLSVIG